MNCVRWMLTATLVVAVGCDQKDAQQGSPSADVKQAPATKVEPTTTAKESAQPTSHVNDEAVVACKEAATNARAKPANRDKILREGCAQMLQNDACREALSGDHAAFWKVCLDAYCPALDGAERSSVLCELDSPPADRASHLPARAAFLTDVMLMERDFDPMPAGFHEDLRSALDAEPAERQAAMKGLIGKAMRSDEVTQQQREVWSVGMMLSIVEPVSPPIDIGGSAR